MTRSTAFLAMLASSMATAPPVSAGCCGHDDHSHSRNAHDHHNEHGYRRQVWHNQAHGDTFALRC